LPCVLNPTDEVEFELEVELDGRLLWASDELVAGPVELDDIYGVFPESTVSDPVLDLRVHSVSEVFDVLDSRGCHLGLGVEQSVTIASVLLDVLTDGLGVHGLPYLLIPIRTESVVYDVLVFGGNIFGVRDDQDGLSGTSNLIEGGVTVSSWDTSREEIVTDELVEELGDVSGVKVDELV